MDLKICCSLALLPLLFAVLCIPSTFGDGVGSYNEHCETGVTPDNKTVLDTCDRQRNLICRQSRCVCQDETNQIWTAIIVPKSRSKRSPKHGVGKAVLAGGVAGVAGGAVGYGLASSLSNSGSGSNSGGNDGSSSGSGSGSGGGSVSSKHGELYYACHSRVGGQCVLQAFSNSPVIVTIDRPADNSPNTSHDMNATTVGGGISVSSSVVTYDISRMTVPKCVQYADCKPATIKIVNGTVVSPVSNDPRLGQCVCQGGYKDNNIDICVKVVNSAMKTGSLSTGFYATLVTLFCVSSVVL